MNSFLFLIIGIPAIEILIMIKIGQNVGAVNTVLLILLTAVIGIYYARIQGINTLRSAFQNVYKNKVPVYEMMSGASIAVAACLLIIPGFLTDILGFALLVPFTRKSILSFIIKKDKKKDKDEVIEAEIIEDKKDEL
ncbi:MAG: hypothetical protein CBD76_01765 [Pelagibacteraceae bacterium TMED216]|nr:MAG: hypothetical protein CBD76_01765 [Pelagibacteraceae bacterium TMED216]|tara:strand:+ start:37 stop:447 length:411 start_codon:yes stop_codon:yes gene_type:complete